MKRVWLVNQYFGPGPAPTGVLLDRLAEHLQRDWRVEVLTGTAEYRADVPSTPTLFTGPVHRFRCGTKGTGLRAKFCTWLKFYLKVTWFILWRRLPDVVIVQTTPPFLHTLFCARTLFAWRKPRIILWNQDTFPESLTATGMMRESSWTYWCLNGIAHWSARHINDVVVLDGAMAGRMQVQGARNITLIPNWETSSPITHDVELPIELTQMAAGYRYKIAYSGNLGRGHDLTPVWNYLHDHPAQADFCFLFIGEGDRTAELRQRVAREGWPSVKFWPYLPASQFQALLRWCDFGLVALDPACLGLMSPSKLHAWLAAGKPVIYIGPLGSNVAETLQGFDCGLIIEPSTPDGFNNAISKLSSPERIEYMRQQARIAWENRHSPHAGLQKWTALLSDEQCN